MMLMDAEVGILMDLVFMEGCVGQNNFSECYWFCLEKQLYVKYVV